MWNQIQRVAIFSAVYMPIVPIDISPFYSGISHWRNIRDETRFIRPEKDQPSYSADQVREIVDNILLFQRKNGGFPQRFPHPKSFHAHITFNDGVMIGIVQMLQMASTGQSPFEWLDVSRRIQAKKAIRLAVDCILKCQIRVDGKRTGWCQQHDEKTFEARPARTFELASVCPQETTDIVRFLMQQPDPSPALVDAGRDGIKKYALAEIERERRTGTAWYGGWPRSLIDKEYAKWSSHLGPEKKR